MMIGYAVLDLALHLLLCCFAVNELFHFFLLAKSCFISVIELHDTHFTCPVEYGLSLSLECTRWIDPIYCTYTTASLFFFNDFLCHFYFNNNKCLYHWRIHTNKCWLTQSQPATDWIHIATLDSFWNVGFLLGAKVHQLYLHAVLGVAVASCMWVCVGVTLRKCVFTVRLKSYLSLFS